MRLHHSAGELIVDCAITKRRGDTLSCSDDKVRLEVDAGAPVQDPHSPSDLGFTCTRLGSRLAADEMNTEMEWRWTGWRRNKPSKRLKQTAVGNGNSMIQQEETC